MGCGASGCHGLVNQGNCRQIYAGPPINFRIPCGNPGIETLTASRNGCTNILMPIGNIGRTNCGVPNLPLLL